MKLALDVENGPRLGTGPRCESYIYNRTKYIFYKWGSPAHMHNPSFNMVYPAFRCGHGKLCHMNFLTSRTVLLKEEEFIDQNRTEQNDFQVNWFRCCPPVWDNW